MTTHLSTIPIWLKRTPEMRSLEGKSLLIIDSNGKSPVRLRLVEANPASLDREKYAVLASRTGLSKPKWQPVLGGSSPSVAQTFSWERYLSQVALDAIQKNQDERFECDLVLKLPETEN